MNPKTMLAWLRAKQGRHRLTVPKHTIKTLSRIVSAQAEALRRQKKSNGKKPVKEKQGGYRRIDEDDRVRIEALSKAGLTPSEIARQLGFHRSTIYRELGRNKSKRGYRHVHAQNQADKRVVAKASARRKFTDEMWRYAIFCIAEGWTFEQVSGRARRDGRAMVCKETLYLEYYRRQRLVLAGLSDEALPPLPKRRKMRKTRDRNAKKYRNAGRGKIPGRVDISERPKEVENRARVGNWEGDLVNGNHGTGNLVTLVERMTRFVLVGYAATKETDVVMGVIAGLFKDLPQEVLRTLTFDNGKEFALFRILKDEFGMDVYFAKPYHSWERGTNENRNGIVRRVLPKGTDFDHITPEQMARIDRLLNDRPMKCLGWRTPREAFMARLAYYLKAA